MLKLFCTILLFCYFFVGYAQTSEVDYWQEMQQIRNTNEDSTRVALLLKIAQRIVSNKPDSALYFANKAMLLSQSISWQKGLADSQYQKGYAHRILGNYTQALAEQLNALLIYEKHRDSIGIIHTTNEISTVYWRNGNYEKALLYDQRALNMAEAMHDLEGMCSTLNSIGVLLYDKKSYQEALNYYFKSFKMAEQLKNKRKMASALHNIGETYAIVGDMSRGFEYLHRSLMLGEELNDKNFIANTLLVFSKLYQKQGNIDESVQYAEKGYQIAQTVGSKQYMQDASLLLYKNYKLRKDIEKALNYHELYVMHKDSLFKETNYKQIAHLQSMHELEKKQAQIETLAKETALQQSANKNHLFIRQILIGAMLAVLVILGMFIKLNTDKKKTNKVLLEQKEEIEQKNIALAQQQQQIIEQNFVLSQQNQKLTNLNAEKDGLVGIVAHDLRAPLNRIKGFAQILGFEENLNEDQHMMLKRIDKTCNGGIALIKDLLLINNIEYESTLIAYTELNIGIFLKTFIEQFETQAQFKQIKLHVIPPAKTILFKTDEVFLSRILDNLISNAIKFTHHGKNIYVKCEEIANKVYFFIKDEGQGLSEDDQQKLFIKFQKLTAKPTGGEESTGLGLAIVKALVDKLHGEIKVESEVDKGTTFIVIFEKNKII
jgi:signal transduction histidine kinase